MNGSMVEWNIFYLILVAGWASASSSTSSSSFAREFIGFQQTVHAHAAAAATTVGAARWFAATVDSATTAWLGRKQRQRWLETFQHSIIIVWKFFNHLQLLQAILHANDSFVSSFVSSRSALVQLSFSSCSVLVQLLFSSCSALVHFLFSSCSVLVQLLFSSCSALDQLFFSSRSALVSRWSFILVSLSTCNFVLRHLQVLNHWPLVWRLCLLVLPEFERLKEWYDWMMARNYRARSISVPSPEKDTPSYR